MYDTPGEKAFNEWVRMLRTIEGGIEGVQTDWRKLKRAKRIAWNAVAIALIEGVTDDRAFENAQRENREKSRHRINQKQKHVRQQKLLDSAELLFERSGIRSRHGRIDSPEEQAQASPNAISGAHTMIIPSSLEDDDPVLNRLDSLQ